MQTNNTSGNVTSTNGGSGGTAFATLTVNPIVPTVTTEIHDATPAVITGGPAGTIAHDQATVTGFAGTATGSVDFVVYANPTCNASGTAMEPFR